MNNPSFSWSTLKSEDIIEKYLSSKNTNSIQYKFYIKNIKNYQIQVNLIVITIFSRWIDMNIIVKQGNFMFSFGLMTCLYVLNKYFYKYFLWKRLEFQAKSEKKNVNDVILQIYNGHRLENTDDEYINSQLSRFWKEPIAWH